MECHGLSEAMESSRQMVIFRLPVIPFGFIGLIRIQPCMYPSLHWSSHEIPIHRSTLPSSHHFSVMYESYEYDSAAATRFRFFPE